MQARSEETRERILLISYNLFLNHGYDTTGVAQICKEAKVSKGAFYHHFPSKHDVFLTLLDTWLFKLNNNFQLIQSENKSIPEQFSMMAHSLTDVFKESDQIPIFLEFWMQSIRDPGVTQKTIAPYYQYLSFFKKQIEKGVAEGSFSTEVNPENASKLLMSFALGTILLCMIEPHREDWQLILQNNLNTILTGLKKES
jgi:AcrR family transcriptional regulator